MFLFCFVFVSKERLDLVRLARKFPEFVDANLTRMFFFRDQIQEFEPLSEHVPMNLFFNYKYQISIDGTVAAYRFPYLLTGDSLILKQESPYYEHFYRYLIPNKHYLPIKADLSNLIEQIDWARKHDDQVRSMIKRAQRFTEQFLLPPQILCYHVQVLQEYAAHLTSTVEIQTDMEEVQHGIDESHIKKDPCRCHRVQVNVSSISLLFRYELRLALFFV